MGFLFPLLLGEEDVLHSYFGIGCFFYALKIKLKLSQNKSNRSDFEFSIGVIFIFSARNKNSGNKLTVNKYNLFPKNV